MIDLYQLELYCERKFLGLSIVESADMVVHLILRSVEHLRFLVHQIVGGQGLESDYFMHQSNFCLAL